MNFARASVKLFLANVLSALLQFLGIVFFARELGASEIGIFFLFQALLGLLSIPADFGLRGAVEKRISEGVSPESFLSSTITLKLVPISLIIFGIFIFSTILNQYIGREFAGYLAIAILLQETAELAIFVLKGELRVGETAILKVIREATWVSGGVILVNYGYGANALVYSLLAGLGLISLIGWYKTSLSLSTPSFTHARSLVDYSRYNFISSLGGYFYNWMDIAIIGLFLTQAHVGAYEVAWRVTAVTMLFSRAIATTLFPQVSQWDALDAKDRIESIIREAITPSTLLVIPAFFGTFVFSHEILGLLFGPEFTIASVVLIILAGEKILQSLHVIFGRALHGIDKPELAAKATIISVCLNLILNVILILLLGIVGAAIATTTSFAVNTLLHGRYLSRTVTIEIPYLEFGWIVLSSTMMAGLLLSIKKLLRIKNLDQLLVIIVFGVLIYGLFVLLLQPIRLKLHKHLQIILPKY